MLVLSLPARFPLRFLLAALLGALHAVAFVDDANWPIQIAALAGLVALTTRAARELEGPRGTRIAARSGAWLGLGFGLGWFMTGISWIYISLHTYGEMNAVIAGAGVLLFATYLSLYPAMASAGYAAFLQRFAPGPMASVAAFASAWTLSEIARGELLTGFPWIAAGYAHVASPLAGYAPIVGVYGVTFLAAAIAAVIALAAMRRGRDRFDAMLARPRMTFALAVALGVPVAGQLLRSIDWSNPAGATIRVRLLQGNVPQDLKFDEARFDAIADAYLAMAEEKPADLVVMPETAFPRFVEDLPDALVARLVRDARTRKIAIAFGLAINEGDGRYFNSVLAVDGTSATTPVDRSLPLFVRSPRTVERAPGPDATKVGPIGPPLLTDDVRPGEDRSPIDALIAAGAQRYDKNHLVPFGEFIPFGFHWFVDLMRMPLGDFTRGTSRPQPMLLAGRRVAFNICYEDLFGEEILRQADMADVLVNVSNVAWFGDSMALPQHLGISRMRSLETARPMLRATNTGMTASIDPHGRVLASLAPFTDGALDVDLQGMSGRTPFMLWGNGAAIAITIAAAIGAWWRARRSRRLRGAVATHRFH